jgi:hypothetical protein
MVRWYCTIHTVPRDDDGGDITAPHRGVVGVNGPQHGESVEAYLHRQRCALLFACG